MNLDDYVCLGVLDPLEYGDIYHQYDVYNDSLRGSGVYRDEVGVQTTDSITRCLCLHSTYLRYYRHKDKRLTPKGNKRVTLCASYS